MQACIVFGRRRFVAQQVAVGTGVEKSLVAVAAAFAEREGDGAVGKTLAHRADYAAHTSVVEPPVFPTLHHEGAEAQLVALLAAVVYLLVAEAVANGSAVAATQAAVEAVVLAVARKLDEATHKNLVAIGSRSHLARRPAQILDRVLVFGVEDLLQLVAANVARVTNMVYNVQWSKS